MTNYNSIPRQVKARFGHLIKSSLQDESVRKSFLNAPDYRSAKNFFQLIATASENKPAAFRMIKVRSIYHEVVKAAISNDPVLESKWKTLIANLEEEKAQKKAFKRTYPRR